MVNLIIVVVITFVVVSFGGGIGYLIYLKTRPKKETWNANIYQLSEGVKTEDVLDQEGNFKIRLNDLVPYSKDVIEKVEKEKGITIYRLQKLGKPIPAIEENTVEYWGPESKHVNLLKIKDSFTILKKGFSKDIGSEEVQHMIFKPLPHSRVNLIKSEIILRKDRLQKEKDILTAITPWIVAGICIIGLVAISYFTINGFVKISDKLQTATEKYTEALGNAKPAAINNYVRTDSNAGPQNNNDINLTDTGGG